jgi:hypothetical protein
MYATFSALFYSASQFLKYDIHHVQSEDIFNKATDMFIALFAMMFGAFQAGSS